MTGKETKMRMLLHAKIPHKEFNAAVRDGTAGQKLNHILEPWFLAFNADVEFHVVMTPDDLGRAGLDALGKKWS